MRYLKGSLNNVLIYGKANQDDDIIVGYIYTDFAGDLNGKSQYQVI